MTIPSAFFLLPLFITLTHSVSWRRDGIGRVIWADALRHTGDIVTASDVNVVACLSVDHGEIKWRYIPGGNVSLRRIAVVESNHTVVVAEFSDGVLGFAEDGHVTWRRGVECRDIGIGEGGVFSSACGKLVTGRGAGEWGGGFGNGRLQFLNGELVSDIDGRLEMKGKWVREEGLSYGSQVVMGGGVVVILSTKGALFALEGRDSALKWKRDVGEKCSIVGGESGVVVLVCLGTVWWISMKDGEIVKSERGVKGGVQGVLEKGCVWVVDEVGTEIGVGEGCVEGRAWVMWEKGGEEVKCILKGVEKWRVIVPEGGKVVNVVVGRGLHWESEQVRPAAVRVTRKRGVLYRYVEGETVMVIVKGGGGIWMMLVEGKGGGVIEMVRHEGVGEGEVIGVKGEGWFLYSFWNQLMMAQELHILDLEKKVEGISEVQQAIFKTVTDVFGEDVTKWFKLRGRTKEEICEVDEAEGGNGNNQCEVRDSGDRVREEIKKLPIVRRSNMIVNRRIVGLDVTETELGLTENCVALLLECGQVSLVSKILLDATSASLEDDGNVAEFVPPYRPVLKLDSVYRESKYVGGGGIVARIRGSRFAPVVGRESASRVLVFGLDLLFDEMQPVGSFDSLPQDFDYVAVIAMIASLVAVYFYTQRLKSRATLSKSW